MTSLSNEEPSSFWTVKIAGVSGSGKTTLLSYIKNSQKLDCITITYSNFLKEFITKELADEQVKNILLSHKGLVLMDEHLEFENSDRAMNYIKENTRGLVLLNPPIEDIIKRIQSDDFKQREINADKILEDRELSRARAVELSEQIGLQLLILDNLNGELGGTVESAIEFIEKLFQYEKLQI